MIVRMVVTGVAICGLLDGCNVGGGARRKGETPTATRPTAIEYPVRGRNGKWGCIDRDYRVVVDFLYDDIHVLVWDQKYVIGWKDGVCHLTDLSGRMVAKATQGILPVGTDRFALYEATKCTVLVAPKKKVLGEYREARFSERATKLIAVQRQDGKWGYVDYQGKLQIPFKFSRTFGFFEGKAAAKVGKMYGYIDKKGSWAIKPRFRYASEFCEGFALVVVGGRFMYIEHSGRNRFGQTFVFGEDFSEGVAVVKADSGGFGYIARTGHYVIGPIFSEAFGFSDGLAAVVLRKHPGGVRKGYINKQGRLVIRFRQDAPKLYPFHGGWAYVEVRNKSGYISKSGYIDRKGNWVWVNGDPRWLQILKRPNTRRRKG